MRHIVTKKIKSIVDRKRAKIFLVKYKYKDKIIKGRIYGFTGYATLMMLRVKENQKVKIDFRVIEGECALAYTQKKEVHILSKDQKDFQEDVTLNVKKGFMRFRIVGEAASVELEIELVDA